MLQALALIGGAALGFLASRRLRRPQATAQAASLARTVGGTLGRRKGLDPPELQRACFSEMVRHVRVNREGRTHAPARYQLLLHPDDLAVVDESRRWFTDGLVTALQAAAADNGWVLDGEVSIQFRADGSRLPGVPSALASSPDSNTPPHGAPVPGVPQPPGGRIRRLALVRDDTGESIPLVPGLITIGRARDRSITIDDNRVSRAHAHLEPRGAGWVLLDDGSANGTRVGTTPLVPGTAHTLRPGDLIAIGPVTLRVAADADSGEIGWQTLDAAERTRISGQVLPPRPAPS